MHTSEHTLRYVIFAFACTLTSTFATTCALRITPTLTFAISFIVISTDIALLSLSLRHIILHYNTLRCIALHHMISHHTTSHHTPPRHITLHAQTGLEWTGYNMTG